MTPALVIVAAAIQGLLMLVDEGHFHRARGLPRWERVGHPLDTLTVIACYAWACLTTPSHRALVVYVALSIFSCVFVTKDEFVHRRRCAPAECWLHGVLFVIHPIVLGCFGWAWLAGYPKLVAIQLTLGIALLAHQIVYWNVLRRHERTL